MSILLTYSLTHDLTYQIWALSILQQINIYCQKYRQMGIQFSNRVEIIEGKEKTARYKQFLLFPQCFQKLSFVDALKLVSME